MHRHGDRHARAAGLLAMAGIMGRKNGRKEPWA